MDKKLMAGELLYVARTLISKEYKYQYDPKHEKKPMGGGWKKTEKGWEQGGKEKGDKNKPVKTFNQHTDSWFDDAMIKDFDKDKDVLAKIDSLIKTKPATENTLSTIIGEIKKLSGLKDDVKKKIENTAVAIKNKEFRNEFKYQYGGSHNDSTSSAAKELLSHIHQSLFYDAPRK